MEYFIAYSQATGSCTTAFCKSIGTSAINIRGLFGPLWDYSVPFSVTGWTLAGVVLFWRRDTARIWKSAGLSRDVYDLMNRMRGANSRLVLLQSLESPRHRMELSELTGIDWKEVDRQLNLLQSFGLISVYAQSGSVKMYRLTEQGRLLLKLIEGLSGKPKTANVASDDSMPSEQHSRDYPSGMCLGIPSLLSQWA